MRAGVILFSNKNGNELHVIPTFLTTGCYPEGVVLERFLLTTLCDYYWAIQGTTLTLASEKFFHMSSQPEAEELQKSGRKAN